MRKNIKLDVAINYVCYWLFFVVSTLKECKTFNFSAFVGISFAIAFKIRKLDCGLNMITSSSTLFMQSKQVDKAAPFHYPLKTLKLKTLASDCVITKDVTTIPLLIYLFIYLYNSLCQVTYVTFFNKRSNLRNLVNH